MTKLPDVLPSVSSCVVLVSNIFYVHPYLGKIPILTNIFQMGWNHQLARDPPQKQRLEWKNAEETGRRNQLFTRTCSSSECTRGSGRWTVTYFWGDWRVELYWSLHITSYSASLLLLVVIWPKKSVFRGNLCCISAGSHAQKQDNSMPGDSKWHFYPLIGGHLTLERITYCTHLKKVTKNCQVVMVLFR